MKFKFEVEWSIRSVEQAPKLFKSAKEALEWIEEKEDAIDGFKVLRIFQISPDN